MNLLNTKLMKGLTVAAGASLATMAPAGAATVYTLDVDYCSTGCLGGGTGGTVSLTDNGSGSVTVDVSLSSVAFHSSSGKGGFDTFAFNLSGTPTIGVSGITAGSGAIFSLHSATAGTGKGALHEDGAGDFEYALECSNCGPSAGDVSDTTLSFTVTAAGLTAADFAVLSSKGSPSSFFAVDVFNTTTTTCTGIIGSDGGTTPVLGGSNDGKGICGGGNNGGGGGGGGGVPEPASLALLGSALFGLGLVRRRFGRR